MVGIPGLKVVLKTGAAGETLESLEDRGKLRDEKS